jgi:DNA-binding CsgD family transcriptional regulator
MPASFHALPAVDAAKLFVTEKTVEYDLTRVYKLDVRSQLDVRSRTELAAARSRATHNQGPG